MYYPKAKQTLMSLAVASACAAFMPAYAQEVASTPGAAATLHDDLGIILQRRAQFFLDGAADALCRRLRVIDP